MDLAYVSTSCNPSRANIPSKIIMPRPLHDQSDVMLPSKLDSSLHMRRRRGIDHIHRVPLVTTWGPGFRKARVVVVVIPGAADWVLLVEEYTHPFFLERWTDCFVVCGLLRMAYGSWWGGLEQTAGECMVESGPC